MQVYGDGKARKRIRGRTPGHPRGILVASDAIGMGLNLNIKRVIFTAMHKFDGEHQDVKRIAIDFESPVYHRNLQLQHPTATSNCRSNGATATVT